MEYVEVGEILGLGIRREREEGSMGVLRWACP